MLAPTERDRPRGDSTWTDSAADTIEGVTGVLLGD
jgi:hypothetical protein